MSADNRQHVVHSRQQTVDSMKGEFLSTTYYLLHAKSGVTLVELLVTMVVFIIVIAASSQIFTGLLTQFKQQTKMAETNIEGIIGLEILRQDIEHAGYGLPWNVTGVADWSGLTNYLEADSIGCTPNPADFNDASATTPGPPRAILSRNDASFSGCGANSVFNGSDYLVIKSVNVARNTTSQKWTYLYSDKTKKVWDSALENLKNSDRVIVISPGSTSTNSRALIVNNGAFFTRYDTTDGFAPLEDIGTRVIYGLDPQDTTGEPYNRRMPFNRADYYIWRNSTETATDEVPDRCAPNTGILRKTVISQKNGQRQSPLPLLDCVADMQVVFGMDTGGGAITYTNDLTGLTAEQIREQVKEVRVYILTHEGQIDRTYTYPTPTVTVGEFGLGRVFDLSGIPDWQHYRWKVYTIVVKPSNLG